MPVEELLNVENPSMYALMIFFAISAIGMIMAIKTRYRRLHIQRMIDDDKLRDVIKDDMKLQKRDMRPETKMPDPQPEWAKGETVAEKFAGKEKKSIDELLDSLKKEGKND